MELDEAVVAELKERAMALFDKGTMNGAENAALLVYAYSIYDHVQEQTRREVDGKWWFGLFAHAQILHDRDSPEKMRDFIIGQFQGKDPYALSDTRGHIGEEMRFFSELLLSLYAVEGIEDYLIAPVLQAAQRFEEAAIDILCDKNLFFTQGHSSLPEDYVSVGAVVIPYLFTGNDLDHVDADKEVFSPDVLGGKYAARVLAAVDVEGICSGRINAESGNDYIYQTELLSFLRFGQGKNLGEEFWLGISSNRDFVFPAYEGLRFLGKGELLFPRFLAHTAENFSLVDLVSIGVGGIGSVDPIFIGHAERLFGEGLHELALSKFLENPSNHYKDVLDGRLGADLFDTYHSSLGWQHITEDNLGKHFSLYLLSDVLVENNAITLGYIFVSESELRRGTAIIDTSTRKLSEPNLPAQANEALPTLFDRYTTFVTAYNAELKQRLSEQAGTHGTN